MGSPIIRHSTKAKVGLRFGNKIATLSAKISEEAQKIMAESGWNEWPDAERLSTLDWDLRLLHLRRLIGKAARASSYEKIPGLELRIASLAVLACLCIDDIKERMWLDRQQ